MNLIERYRLSAVVVFIVLIFSLFYIIFSDEGNETKKEQIASAKQKQTETAENFSFFVPPDWQYQEAPNPDQTVESFLKSRELWPDIGNRQPTEEHREKIRREWQEFAARHPDNLFIPNEFKNLSPAQIAAIRRDNDLAGDRAAQQAAFAAREKYRPPGENPPESELPPPNPAEQRAWLDYKIRETRSVIEVIDYFIEKGDPDSAQQAEALRDLARLKKELNGYEKAYAEIPKQ